MTIDFERKKKWTEKDGEKEAKHLPNAIMVS